MLHVVSFIHLNLHVAYNIFKGSLELGCIDKNPNQVWISEGLYFKANYKGAGVRRIRSTGKTFIFPFIFCTDIPALLSQYLKLVVHCLLLRPIPIALNWSDARVPETLYLLLARVSFVISTSTYVPIMALKLFIQLPSSRMNIKHLTVQTQILNRWLENPIRILKTTIKVRILLWIRKNLEYFLHWQDCNYWFVFIVPSLIIHSVQYKILYILDIGRKIAHFLFIYSLYY